MFILSRHLNKVRWTVQIVVFCLLVLLPLFSVYQNFAAAHAYDFLAPDEKSLYDFIEWLTAPFVSQPVRDLNALKGTTWSGTLFGLQLSDPLAVISQVVTAMALYWPFIITAAIPVFFTAVFGRFYCGWLCPANVLYEINDKIRDLLTWAGVPLRQKRMDGRLKYVVLIVGLVISALFGWIAVSAIYPPAIIGRELYFGLAAGGIGAGSGFLLMTVLFDLLVARRGICRTLCPGGALFSLLGRYRLVRIQREVKDCNDCGLCNQACMFALDPMRDGFGQECNNCTACMADCPTDCLKFSLSLKDIPYQGHGFLSPVQKKQQKKEVEEKVTSEAL